MAEYGSGRLKSRKPGKTVGYFKGNGKFRVQASEYGVQEDKEQRASHPARRGWKYSHARDMHMTADETLILQRIGWRSSAMNCKKPLP